MKKNMILISIMLFAFLFAGCGNDVETDGNTVSTVEEIESNVSQTIEMDSKEQSAEKEVKDSNSESNKDYNYVESEDLYFIDKIDIGDGNQVVDFSKMESFSTHYVIPESIDIYSYFGTYAGYTKPNIEIRSGRKNDEWTRICFAETSFLVKTEDFNSVAQIIEENNDEDNEVNESQKMSDSFIESEVHEINTEENTSTQEIATQETNIYTAEDAISDYRAIMEANGIAWDPSIKEFASWGTGMLPLNKAEVEEAASLSVESFAMGDSGGHPWTKYYLEVTGSDENYVYVTSYCCD